jgi:hypothetical protein
METYRFCQRINGVSNHLPSLRSRSWPERSGPNFWRTAIWGVPITKSWKHLLLSSSYEKMEVIINLKKLEKCVLRLPLPHACRHHLPAKSVFFPAHHCPSLAVWSGYGTSQFVYCSVSSTIRSLILPPWFFLYNHNELFTSLFVGTGGPVSPNCCQHHVSPQLEMVVDQRKSVWVCEYVTV